MKTLFFIMTLAISMSVCAAPAEPAEATPDYQTCMIDAPDVGKIKFRGTNRAEAFEQTTRACLQSRIEMFVRKRGTVPSTERKILFAEDCVNKTYCKH